MRRSWRLVDKEPVLAPEPARDAYQRLAPTYDLYTEAYDYDRWLGELEELAREHGLRGRRLLDVACGTGNSFLPMIERGYEVVACDISPAMIERARVKPPPRAAELHVADMRRLPVLGAFDLVTCLDDSINYLTNRDELKAAMRGIAANLSPGGLLVFDVNTLSTYRESFRRDAVREVDDVVFCWRGQGKRRLRRGQVVSARVDVFHPEGNGLWRRAESRHCQRHFPRRHIERAVRVAGLSTVAVRGQALGARIKGYASERRHPKLVYVARKEERT